MIQQEFLRSLPGDPAALAMRPKLMRRLRLDLPMLLVLIVLAVFGLAVLYSASGQSVVRVQRQAVYFLVAFVVMFITAQFSLKTIRALSPIGYAVGILMLALVPFFGVEVNGSQRWLDAFGLLRFQPSEVMKILVPLTVAAYLANSILPPSFFRIIISLAIALVPFGLIVIQPDLGTSLLVAMSGLLVIWLAGIQWRYLVGASVMAAASAWPAWHYLLEGYQRQRILTLFNPESDKLGAGWNIIQSKTAIGSGGVTGKGWFNGTQSQLDFLPEGHTDFIIAVLAEELGFVGVSFLALLYAVLIIRGGLISLNARDTFGRLVAGSITFTFFIYVLVNMGMVAGMLPVVGVPLPLVSYGGTALLTMMVNFGILMAIKAESDASTLTA